MEAHFDYAGKRTVVTGASSGIGRATAEILVDLGAEVHALDVNPPPSYVGSFTRTDLRDRDSIGEAVQAVGAGGPVHALFNCAGIGGSNAPLDILLCNFCGTRHLTEQVIPLMGDGSAIATVSSVAGQSWRNAVDQIRPLVLTRSHDEARRWSEANANNIEMPYGFTKRCLTFWTMLQIPRLASLGLRINVVSPGATATGMWIPFEGRMSEDAVADAKGPAGRTAQPWEQASALLFLNSAMASYVNGADLNVDGGREAAKVAQEFADPAIH